MGLPGGVTVRCRTLQPVALTHWPLAVRVGCEIAGGMRVVNQKKCNILDLRPGSLNDTRNSSKDKGRVVKKPTWVIEKERGRRASAAATVWLFGLHAVADALVNPNRERLRLVLTQNAAGRIAEAVEKSGMTPEIVDPRKFNVPLDKGSVHQGAALEVKPLNWGSIDEVVAATESYAPIIVALDRVSDPHNAGAILRSAEVFGAAAVIAPHRHSAPETGALSKTASGALERQPYLRVKNLGNSLQDLANRGFTIIGLDGEGDIDLPEAIALAPGPVVLVLGAEGPGLRERTKGLCHHIAKISPAGGFGSLNVSNAAAVALFCAATSRTKTKS